MFEGLNYSADSLDRSSNTKPVRNNGCSIDRNTKQVSFLEQPPQPMEAWGQRRQHTPFPILDISSEEEVEKCTSPIKS